MTYLDTNVFVYAAINNGHLGAKCRNILSKIAESKSEAFTSILTWDEFVYSIWKKENKEKAIAEGKLFLKLPNISFIGASYEIINKSQRIIEKYNLKPRDAIHAASAIISGMKEIISDDSDFDKVKELKRIKV